MFKEYSEKVFIPKVEEDVLSYWQNHNIFEKSLQHRKDAPTYIFNEGPPTANGRPGIHHVLSRTIKDIVNRYKSMKGYQVPRKAGWDTHGLPVEIAVEKKLGLTQKNEIETFGIEKFNNACRELVNEHIEMADGWRKLTDRMGYWLDLDNAYITYKNEYIESVWWAIKTIFDKGLIYKSFKIVPQSPTIETPLSSHELSQAYIDVRDPNCYIKVKVTSSPKASIRNAELVIWTTTPWTLISNVAAAVGEDIDYVLVKNSRQIKSGDEKTELVNSSDKTEFSLPSASLSIKMFSVARAAAQLTGWPPKVVMCPRMGLSDRALMTAWEAMKAPMGMPPPMPLASSRMSGTMPYCSKAKRCPVRP